jgi:exopolyphosphatase / guanosine-5'-triphosphate,3'-diphosphate pyrophosphatase
VGIAIIDIGTNTVLLLIADIDRAGHLVTLEYQQRVPRLGRGVDKRKTLRQDSMQRVINVLLEYRTIIANYRPDVVQVCGTSAVRDAANREEFAGLVKARTGFDLEILSGDDEALWTYRGAVSGIPALANATVVDIGGGSTELTRGTAHAIITKTSLNIGSVRLTERLLSHDPPLPDEISRARAAVTSALASLSLSFPRGARKVVAVAGTATTLALLAQGRQKFDLQAVSGFVLSRSEVRALVSRLQQLSSSEILRLAEYLEGRNDIITMGAIILEEVMNVLGTEEVIVSERGVRYGIAIREWERREKSGGQGER